MSLEVPLGIGPPSVMQEIVWAKANPIDLSTATGIVLSVKRKSDGVVVSWPASIVSSFPPSTPGGSYLIWQHAWQVTDITVVTIYSIQPLITVPGGTLPVGAKYLYGVDPYTPFGSH